jgi:hypothetical protein
MRKALRTALVAVLVAASTVLATPASAQHHHGGHGSHSQHYGDRSYNHGYYANPSRGHSHVRFSLGASRYYGQDYSYGYYGPRYYDPYYYYDDEYSYRTPYYGAYGQVYYRGHRHHGHH